MGRKEAVGASVLMVGLLVGLLLGLFKGIPVLGGDALLLPAVKLVDGFLWVKLATSVLEEGDARMVTV